MPRGGYQKPANPAPVSGPGALSQRTDGKQPVMNLPNAGYGENQAYREQQTGAPMAQSTPNPAAPSGAGAVAGRGGPPNSANPNAGAVTPFGAPTAKPDEPVTHGAALGPGGGTEVMNFANQRNEDMSKMAGALQFLRFMANQPDSSWAARNAVRKMTAGQQ